MMQFRCPTRRLSFVGINVGNEGAFSFFPSQVSCWKLTTEWTLVPTGHQIVVRLIRTAHAVDITTFCHRSTRMQGPNSHNKYNQA